MTLSVQSMTLDGGLVAGQQQGGGGGLGPEAAHDGRNLHPRQAGHKGMEMVFVEIQCRLLHV